uniref:Uncharacterized protein n=1 Tax=Arundo donax TaxID=35708 RepID=A0A0A8ZE22_ARUDO
MGPLASAHMHPKSLPAPCPRGGRGDGEVMVRAQEEGSRWLGGAGASSAASTQLPSLTCFPEDERGGASAWSHCLHGPRRRDMASSLSPLWSKAGSRRSDQGRVDLACSSFPRPPVL